MKSKNNAVILDNPNCFRMMKQCVKTLCGSMCGGLATLLTLCCATSVQAGAFTWSAPVGITSADVTLAQPGTIVGAETFGPIESFVVLTDGTAINFKIDDSVATVSSAGGSTVDFRAFLGDTGNAAFNTALTQKNHDGGPKQITLNNLTLGQQYSVQLFALDEGSGAGNTASFQDPNDASNVSDTFAMGDKAYVMGVFTATGSTMSIQENLTNNNNGSINALVVRALGVTWAPKIITPPQSATVYSGQSANLPVTAYGTGLLSYQWQAGAMGSGVFTNVVNSVRISGASSALLTISNSTSFDGADYRVVVSSPNGSATSVPATLSVLEGSPLFVWSAPTPITTVEDTLNISGTVVGAAAFGNSPQTVTLTNGTVVDFKADGSVAQVVSGGIGIGNGGFSGNTGDTSFNAALSQFRWDGGPMLIQLKNLTVGKQYSVQLFALDDRDTATARLANYQDPNDYYYSSATFAMGQNVYVIGTFTATDTTVIIQENLLTGNAGNINALVVRAIGGGISPSISTAPQSTSAYTGATVHFNVIAAGTPPFTYQWQAGAVGSGVFTNLHDGGSLSGSTTTSLTLSGVTAANAADFQVIVSSAYGSVTSAPPATLTVNAGSTLYQWSAPVPITTADATLKLNGQVVGAEGFGLGAGGPTDVSLNDNTVITFMSDGSVATATGNGLGSGGFSGDTGNANFNAVLGVYNYDGGPKTITLKNLTVGQSYSVQLFAIDDRFDSTKSRRASYQDPNDNSYASAVFTMGDNVYVVGTFTAVSTNAVIKENLLDGGNGNINALVLRTVVISPTLSVSANPGSGSITFSWPATATGYKLETSPGLGANAVWTPVPGSPIVDGSNLKITVPTTNPAAFFRLHQ